MLKILLVEDEAVIAMLMCRQLAASGYPVAHQASTGESAILRSREEKPDLILMDIRLAGEMDGIEAARQILSEQKMPIIFCTGYADPSVLRRAMELKPAGFLLKPVDMVALRSLLAGVDAEGAAP